MAFKPLVGTELLQVIPLRWDGTPSPVSEITNTQAIADLASSAPFTGDASAATSATTIAGTINRALNSRFTDRVSLLDFGVSGNGSDETALYQAALNACAGRCELLHPAGLTVTTTARLNIPANSALTLHGTILAQANLTAQLFSMIGFSGGNVSIQGHGLGKIDANKANRAPFGGVHPSAGIESGVANLTNIYISGVEIANCPNWPVNLTLNISRCVVEFCVMHDSGNSVEYSHATDCHFLYNLVYNIADDGMGMYAACNNCTMIGNTVHDCSTGPFVLADSSQPAVCSNIVVADNNCYSNTNTGLFISALAGTVHSGITMTGNNSSGNGTATAGSLIHIANVTNLILSNNIAVGTAGANFGLQMQGTISYSKICNNTIGNTTAYAILYQNTTAGASNPIVVFSDNVIIGTNGTTIVGLFLNLTASISAQTYAFDNVFTGAFAGGVFNDAGGSAVFRGNNNADNAQNVELFSRSIHTEANLTVDGATTLTGAAALNGPTTINGSVIIASQSLEMGSLTVAGSVFYDAHSSGNNIDYDSRWIYTGGNATVGQGSAQLIASGGFAISAPTIVQSSFGMTSNTISPATGFALVIPDNISRTQINGSGALAAGTLTMPVNPKQGQLIFITASHTVTAFTLLPNTGQTMDVAANTPTTLVAGQGVEYIFIASTWYRQR